MEHEYQGQINVVGVGIGPFNLSVAALLQPLREVRSRFFERRKEFQWHPGLLFPEATIQVSFLKDLVTLADPTSPYSFLSFLSQSKRLYRFINANYARVTRREFNQYLRWVCASLSNLEFDRSVHAVNCDGKSLLVETDGGTLRTNNIILGTGLTPLVPDCARPHLCETVLHAANYLKPPGVKTAGLRVAVVGGGQTGAEIVNHLLSDPLRFPRELIWVTRRPNFLPLDESPFTNELFTPNYSRYFFRLPPGQKAALLAEQKLASDGILNELLESIYRRLYELEFLSDHGRLCKLYSRLELSGIDPDAEGWRLTFKDDLSGRANSLGADVVILCTGFKYQTPECITPLLPRVSLDRNGFCLRDDFSLEWDGPPSLRIYVQNAARHSRGIADPNLSLMAWRSAKIINSIVGRCVYNVEDDNSIFDWPLHEPVGAMEEAFNE